VVLEEDLECLAADLAIEEKVFVVQDEDDGRWRRLEVL
jgi:hypothetical protein